MKVKGNGRTKMRQDTIKRTNGRGKYKAFKVARHARIRALWADEAYYTAGY